MVHCVDLVKTSICSMHMDTG